MASKCDFKQGWNWASTTFFKQRICAQVNSLDEAFGKRKLGVENGTARRAENRVVREQHKFDPEQRALAHAADADSKALLTRKQLS